MVEWNIMLLVFIDGYFLNVSFKGTNMNAEELDRESLMRSRLPWAGHIERMVDDRLPKRTGELEVWF